MQGWLALDGQHVLAEIGRDGSTAAAWTHTSDRWGELLSERRSERTHIFGFDPSSNTRLLIDDAGHLSAGLVYEAYGVERGAVVVEAATPFRFGGEFGYWLDAVDELHVRARWLDAVAGMRDSRDPIGLRGGAWNLYRYIGNSATVKTDPSGLLVGGNNLGALILGCAVGAGLTFITGMANRQTRCQNAWASVLSCVLTAALAELVDTVPLLATVVGACVVGAAAQATKGALNRAVARLRHSRCNKVSWECELGKVALGAIVGCVGGYAINDNPTVQAKWRET